MSKVKNAMAKRGESNPINVTVVPEMKNKKNKVSIPSDAVLDERYDRMSRKDFSRKICTIQPSPINDTYANFRFSKRAGEVLSPLSKSKFGLTTSSHLRKMSLGMNPFRTEMRLTDENSGSMSKRNSPKLSMTTYAGQKSARHNSIGFGGGSTKQNDFA